MWTVRVYFLREREEAGLGWRDERAVAAIPVLFAAIRRRTREKRCGRRRGCAAGCGEGSNEKGENLHFFLRRPTSTTTSTTTYNRRPTGSEATKEIFIWRDMDCASNTK